AATTPNYLALIRRTSDRRFPWAAVNEPPRSLDTFNSGGSLMRLLPQDAAFFDLFDAQVDAVVESAASFGRLAADFSRLSEEAKVLDDIEHRADGITHEL